MFLYKNRYEGCSAPKFVPKYPQFSQREDGSGRKQIFPDQKLLAALNQLCLGICPEHCGKYFQIGVTTARNSKTDFCQIICELYQEEYLSPPKTVDELSTILERNKVAHGLEGMLGSIDCVHWNWEACPVAHQGMCFR